MEYLKPSVFNCRRNTTPMSLNSSIYYSYPFNDQYGSSEAPHHIRINHRNRYWNIRIKYVDGRIHQSIPFPFARGRALRSQKPLPYHRLFNLNFPFSFFRASVCSPLPMFFRFAKTNFYGLVDFSCAPKARLYLRDCVRLYLRDCVYT